MLILKNARLIPFLTEGYEEEIADVGRKLRAY